MTNPARETENSNTPSSADAAKKPSRRRFLKIAGSSAVIIAAGAGGFLATRTPHKALEPWSDVGSRYTDPMRRALSYAILAPNPHNRQPWVVELKGGQEAILRCDTGRLLPHTDPYSRQIVIGLGCFIELFSLAAASHGYVAEVEAFPEGAGNASLDSRPIANLRLVKSAEAKSDPLFAHVLKRHTNREPYDLAKPIDPAVLARMAAAAGTSVRFGSINDGERLEVLRRLTRDAILGEIKDPVAYGESVELMRFGRAEIEANPDGIFLGGPFLETLRLVGALDRRSVADPTSNAYKTGLDIMEESAMATMGYAWIATRGNDRLDQIKAGRVYMRLALQAAGDGLSMQPMSQALQEYPAMAPFYDKVHEMLAEAPGERLQMLVRLGYAADPGPSPRWPLETRLVAG